MLLPNEIEKLTTFISIKSIVKKKFADVELYILIMDISSAIIYGAFSFNQSLRIFLNYISQLDLDRNVKIVLQSEIKRLGEGALILGKWLTRTALTDEERFDKNKSSISIMSKALIDITTILIKDWDEIYLVNNYIQESVFKQIILNAPLNVGKLILRNKAAIRDRNEVLENYILEPIHYITINTSADAIYRIINKILLNQNSISQLEKFRWSIDSDVYSYQRIREDWDGRYGEYKKILANDIIEYVKKIRFEVAFLNKKPCNYYSVDKICSKLKILINF